MVNKAAALQTTQVDPMVYIPEGVIDIKYVDDEDLTPGYSGDGSDSTTYDVFTTEEPGGSALEPGTPVVLRIVSQTLHAGAVGNDTVDVVIEVSDVKGLPDVEYRITKA